MTTRFRALLVMCIFAAVCLGAVATQAPNKPSIAYPAGYRKWTHVKTMVIFSKENKLFDRFGGLHNVYVNGIGWPALQQGRTYPDGSMFAFELFDTRTFQGAIEARARKFVAVMKKNSRLYPKTGGWGFEVFQGYQATGSLKDSQECFDCHASRKARDYVYSDYVE
jgi:hypothetical protein